MLPQKNSISAGGRSHKIVMVTKSSRDENTAFVERIEHFLCLMQLGTDSNQERLSLELGPNTNSLEF